MRVTDLKFAHTPRCAWHHYYFTKRVYKCMCGGECSGDDDCVERKEVVALVSRLNEVWVITPWGDA